MNEVNEISLDGFKVVSGDYFKTPYRLMAPTATIWPDGSIGFSKQDILMLNSCENILLQINTETRKIIVIPTTSKDKDALNWIRKADPLEARKFSSKKLTDKLYESWGWDKNRIYRTLGKLVTASNKVMLLFDFSEAESWKKSEGKNE